MYKLGNKGIPLIIRDISFLNTNWLFQNKVLESIIFLLLMHTMFFIDINFVVFFFLKSLESSFKIENVSS